MGSQQQTEVRSRGKEEFKPHGEPYPAPEAGGLAPLGRAGRGNGRGREPPAPPGHSTHHIVADADERAAEAREILRKVGINPRNDWRNGVHLPQNVGNPRTVPEAFTQHATLHTDSYYDAVNDRLREAYTGTGYYKNSPILDPATRIEDELARLYEDIAQGRLPHLRKRD